MWCNVICLFTFWKATPQSCNLSFFGYTWKTARLHFIPGPPTAIKFINLYQQKCTINLSQAAPFRAFFSRKAPSKLGTSASMFVWTTLACAWSSGTCKFKHWNKIQCLHVYCAQYSTHRNSCLSNTDSTRLWQIALFQLGNITPLYLDWYTGLVRSSCVYRSLWIGTRANCPYINAIMFPMFQTLGGTFN